MAHRTSPSGLLLFYLALALVVGSVQASGAALDGGRITVTVINPTTGQPLKGQAVTLQRHLGEQTAIALQGVTDNAGRFAFVSLPVDSAHYVVTTQYLGVEYMTESVSLQDSSTTRDVSLNVYPTTTRDDAIVVDAHHLIIEVKPEMLDVTEILVVHNNGNETFVSASDSASGTTRGVALSVPPNAIQFQAMTPGVEGTTGAPAYTRPIPPGPAQIVYAYSLDRKSIDNVFTTRIAYDTGRVQVLIAPSSLSVTSPNLTNSGVRQMGDKSYLLLSNSNGLQKGGTLEIRFPRLFIWQDMIKWGALGLVVLMVAAGVSVPYFLKRRKPAAAPSHARPARAEREKVEHQYQDLLQGIADLDDRYDAGEVDRAAYQRQRSELKGRAVESLRRMSGEADG